MLVNAHQMLRAKKGQTYARALEKFSEHLKLLEPYSLPIDVFCLSGLHVIRIRVHHPVYSIHGI